MQRETKYPIELIARIQTLEEYQTYRAAGLATNTIGGRLALIRKIDLKFKDPTGRTNLQRMLDGYAPLDPKTGLPYELHHIGQKMDSPLAVLTKAEHDSFPNLVKHSEINRNVFAKERTRFWKELGKLLEKGKV